MQLQYAIILVGVSFSRSEFWWGDQGGCGFYVSVLPELFIYTIVYTYWLPSRGLGPYEPNRISLCFSG